MWEINAAGDLEPALEKKEYLFGMRKAGRGRAILGVLSAGDMACMGSEELASLLHL